MKKLLLATSILAGTAGIASAEVTLSGDARMGVSGSSGGDATLTSRARVSFGLSGESDAGLSFGASFRADNAVGAEAGSAGSVFVSGAFGKLSMGGVDSADAAIVGQLHGVGLTGLGDTNEVAYAADGVSYYGFIGKNNAHTSEYCVGEWEDDGWDYLSDCVDDYSLSSGSAKLLYTLTAGDLSVAASMGADGSADNYALAASYTTNGLTAAVGFGRNTVTGYDYYWGDEADVDVKDITASIAYTTGGTTLKSIYQRTTYVGEWDGEDFDDAARTYGLSASHKIDALTVTGFWKQTKHTIDEYGFAYYYGDSSVDSGFTLTSYGIGVAYDLGGGASLAAGVANADSVSWDVDDGDAELANSTVWDLGLSFSF